MKLALFALVSSIVSTVVLTGCADPALVEVSPNAYRIVKTDKLHFYRTTAELKAQAVADANAYAASRGKVAIALSTSEQPLVPGVEFASVKYAFRLVDKGDPDAPRRISVTQAPIMLDRVEAPTGAASASADIAALDQMHQRGVINDVEFRTMKARLLVAKTPAPVAPVAPVAEASAVKP